MAKPKFNFIGLWPADIDQAKVLSVLKTATEQDAVNLTEGDINIKLVDDTAITALNKQYTGNDYVTDVLAFSYHQVSFPATEIELGDIAISLPKARQQAQQAKTGITSEVALLALHGVLHIAGLNHDTDEGRHKMNYIQDNVLDQHQLKYREFGWQKDM